jgi:hypothetical protein
MEPFLSVIVEYNFGVYDGNVEVLQSSVDGDNIGLGEILNIGFFVPTASSISKSEKRS